MYYEKEIAGYTLSYTDKRAFYLLDDTPVPTFSALLFNKYEKKIKYAMANTARLIPYHKSELHAAIVKPEEGKTDFREYKNFLKYRELYAFKVTDTDVPVILFDRDGKPIAADIVDLIIEQATGVSGVIVKTQKTMDRRYLTDKVNLLAMAYEQTYGKKWDYCKCLQLHRDLRKLVALTFNPSLADDLIVQYSARKNNAQL